MTRPFQMQAAVDKQEERKSARRERKLSRLPRSNRRADDDLSGRGADRIREDVWRIRFAAERLVQCLRARLAYEYQGDLPAREYRLGRLCKRQPRRRAPGEILY